MTEASFISLYRELTGSSEMAARSVLIYLEAEILATEDRRDNFESNLGIPQQRNRMFHGIS